MEQTDSCKRGADRWLKEGEGVSQRMYMNDPRTGTMVWGLPEGVRDGLGGGRQRGKIGITVIA